MDSGTTYLPISHLYSSRIAYDPHTSLADRAEGHAAQQMSAQKEGEQRDGEQKEHASGRDRRPVRQTGTQLRRDERRRSLRVAVSHHQRERVLVPSGNEAEYGGCRDS